MMVTDPQQISPVEDNPTVT